MRYAAGSQWLEDWASSPDPIGEADAYPTDHRPNRHVQSGSGITATAAAGRTTPPLLLRLIAVMGVGQASSVPSFPAIQPELVSRSEVPQAAVLNDAHINVARGWSRGGRPVLVEVAAWHEHLRQHLERGTVWDRELEASARALTVDGTEPMVRHMIWVAALRPPPPQ